MKAIVVKGESISKYQINPYSVGLQRLKELCIPAKKFEQSDIEYIGRCSMLKHKPRVRIGKVGNQWCIEGRDAMIKASYELKYHRNAEFKLYHIVVGKKCITIHPSTSNGRTMNQIVESYKHGWSERGVALSEATTEQIFFEGYGKKPTRKCKSKVKIQTKVAYEMRCDKLRQRSK